MDQGNTSGVDSFLNNGDMVALIAVLKEMMAIQQKQMTIQQEHIAA